MTPRAGDARDTVPVAPSTFRRPGRRNALRSPATLRIVPARAMSRASPRHSTSTTGRRRGHRRAVRHAGPPPETPGNRSRASQVRSPTARRGKGRPRPFDGLRPVPFACSLVPVCLVVFLAPDLPESARGSSSPRIQNLLFDTQRPPPWPSKRWATTSTTPHDCPGRRLELVRYPGWLTGRRREANRPRGDTRSVVGTVSGRPQALQAGGPRPPGSLCDGPEPFGGGAFLSAPLEANPGPRLARVPTEQAFRTPRDVTLGDIAHGFRGVAA